MAKESVPSKDRESRKLKDFRNEHRPHFVGEEAKQYKVKIEKVEICLRYKPWIDDTSLHITQWLSVSDSE